MRINSEHEVPSRSSCVISALTHHTFPKPLRYLEDIHSQLKPDGSFFFLFPPAVSFFSILETLHRLIILHVGESVCTWELEAGHITSLPHYIAMLAWKCFKWTVFPWQCMSEVRVWGKKTNTNKHGCFVISTACFCLSLSLHVSLFVSLQIAEWNRWGFANNRSVSIEETVSPLLIMKHHFHMRRQWVFYLWL